MNVFPKGLYRYKPRKDGSGCALHLVPSVDGGKTKQLCLFGQVASQNPDQGNRFCWQKSIKFKIGQEDLIQFLYCFNTILAGFQAVRLLKATGKEINLHEYFQENNIKLLNIVHTYEKKGKISQKIFNLNYYKGFFSLMIKQKHGGKDKANAKVTLTVPEIYLLRDLFQYYAVRTFEFDWDFEAAEELRINE